VNSLLSPLPGCADDVSLVVRVVDLLVVVDKGVPSGLTVQTNWNDKLLYYLPCTSNNT